MIKAVIDTNVIVSAYINKDSPPAKILNKVFDGEILMYIDERILDEYKRVLSYPKLKIGKKNVDFFTLYLEHNAEYSGSCAVIRDANVPDDDVIFLEVAMKAKVQYLITGNTKLFNFRNYAGCKIITPAEFIALLK